MRTGVYVGTLSTGYVITLWVDYVGLKVLWCPGSLLVLPWDPEALTHGVMKHSAWMLIARGGSECDGNSYTVLITNQMKHNPLRSLIILGDYD